MRHSAHFAAATFRYIKEGEMKKLICLTFMIAGLATVAMVPRASTASANEGSVTGIGSGSFPEGATLGPVEVTGFELATGLFTEADGSASGVFHVVLNGRTIVGGERRITIEGNVTQGTVLPSGASSFGGVATMDFGDGAPAISGVPFSADVSAGGIVLTVQSTTLPHADLVGEGLTIE